MNNRIETRCQGTCCPFYRFTSYENEEDGQPWMKATCRVGGEQPLFQMRDNGEFVEALLVKQPCVAPVTFQGSST